MGYGPEQIDVEKIPHADLRDVVEALYGYLKVKVMCEQGPDYTFYKIEAE